MAIRSGLGFRLFSLCLLVALLSACGKGPTPPIRTEIPTPPILLWGDTFPIDPVFTEFYNFLGGEKVLGPAITPVIEVEGRQNQYVEAGLLVYNPQAVESERFRLASLGSSFGVAEPPVPDPKQPDLRYLNGHIIYPEFLALYERLGGAQFVGKPLTEARHNPEKGRIEQYFENLGFYRMDYDPPGAVRLLAYGMFACDRTCRYQAPPASIPSLRPPLPEPFESKAASLGLELLGRTLSEPHPGPDGKLEVIFENAVLVLEPVEQQPVTITFNSWLPQIMHISEGQVQPIAKQLVELFLPFITLKPKEGQALVGIQLWLPQIDRQTSQIVPPQAVLRPIVEMVGIQRQPPMAEHFDPLIPFYAIGNQLGYPVPKNFDHFISTHGGLAVFGQPVTQLFVTGGIYRQCFQNLCLDFNPTAEVSQQVKPAPLGLLYQEKYSGAGVSIQPQTGLQNIHLQVWEGKPYLTSQEGQEIFALVEDDRGPLANQKLHLSLTKPDGSKVELDFPLTDTNGGASLQVPPVSAASGVLVPYEVCLNVEGQAPLCQKGDYLIWNYP